MEETGFCQTSEGYCGKTERNACLGKKKKISEMGGVKGREFGGVSAQDEARLASGGISAAGCCTCSRFFS